MSSTDEVLLIDWITDKVRTFSLRLVRAVCIAGAAFWLSEAQTHVHYSTLSVTVLVLLFASLNRFYWIAGLIVGWLVILYLVPPDAVAALKALAEK